MKPSQGTATPDPLTEVATRATFDLRCNQEWRRGTRDASSLSLLLLELDDPRPREDRLRQIAWVLRSPLSRPGDFVARYTDTRFAVLLPITDSVGALIVAESLRTAMDALKGSRTTVSIGVASLVPSQERALSSLLAAAEKALAAARQGGGNRIERSIL